LSKLAYRKRPIGLTLIAAIWLFSGLATFYFGFSGIWANLDAIIILSDPTNQSYIAPWIRITLPALFSLYSLFLFLGLLQLINFLGLWAAKRFSFKLSLAIPVAILLSSVSWIGLGFFIPASDIGYYAFGVAGVIWSIAQFLLYWGYLCKAREKDH
jgi:hypothetical protein